MNYPFNDIRMKHKIWYPFPGRFKAQVIFLLLVYAGLHATGQNSYNLFKYYESFNPDNTGKFYTAVENVNFFRNNEYKKEIADGYTLTGAWLRPKMVYYPDKKLRLELGGHVLKYNGRDEYYHLSPWFNVHYQPTRKITVILGNLNSDANHNLPEPIADPELFLTSRPEAGLQAKYQSERFTSDLWIDWQKFIVRDDPFKERFVFGSSLHLKLIDKKGTVLSFPLSFYGMHQGGEIDLAPGLAQTFIAITPGLTLRKTVSDPTFRSWGLNASYSICTYPRDEIADNQSGGRGLYINSNVETRMGGLTLAYWYGHHFYTPQGGKVFQNYRGTATQGITDNKLINLNYHFVHEIMKDTFFGFNFDYYYDTIRKQTMNSEGLYLIVNFGIAARRLNAPAR